MGGEKRGGGGERHRGKEGRPHLSCRPLSGGEKGKKKGVFSPVFCHAAERGGGEKKKGKRTNTRGKKVPAPVGPGPEKGKRRRGAGLKKKKEGVRPLIFRLPSSASTGGRGKKRGKERKVSWKKKASRSCRVRRVQDEPGRGEGKRREKIKGEIPRVPRVVAVARRTKKRGVTGKDSGGNERTRDHEREHDAEKKRENGKADQKKKKKKKTEFRQV